MRWLLFSVLLAMTSSLSAQQGTVKSELSASSVTLDESVTLSIFAIGVEGELDTSALDQDFDIVGRSSSRQINSIGGSNNQSTVSSVVTWTLELMPRKAGVFTVPAVTVGGMSSELLSLTVNEISASARRDVFVEATVDTRTPWVQSQVLMSVRVFQGIEIVDGGLSDPAGKDIQVERIGKDVYTNEERDGRRYSVTERRFALFPQKSGSLQIDPVVLSVSVPANAGQRGIFSSTRKLTRRTDSLQLEVQARPSTGTAWWLPARSLTLASNWAGGNTDARVDQPLTRTVTMRGVGILDSQLPDISIPAIDGVSLYAEEPVKAMVVDELGLQAEQTIKWALIPQREGELVLPAVSVEWFNTETGKTETAMLPEEIVSVGPAVDTGHASSALSGSGTEEAQAAPLSEGSGESVPPLSVDTTAELPDSTLAAITSERSTSQPDKTVTEAERTDTALSIENGNPEGSQLISGTDALQAQIASLQTVSNRWKLTALTLLGLWVTSLAFVWWRKRDLIRREKVAGKRLGAVRKHANAAYQSLAPLAAVEAACTGSDPAAVRGALLEWAARQWPEQSPATLTALASRFDEGGAARELIKALDASLYSRAQGASANTDLISRLGELPGHMAKAQAGKKRLIKAEKYPHTQALSDKAGRGLPEL
ncbi:BatD family protein [Granulosicoccus antarcticus]|nr:BatD family protein [Granulosicoccus antarcticus]